MVGGVRVSSIVHKGIRQGLYTHLQSTPLVSVEHGTKARGFTDLLMNISSSSNLDRAVLAREGFGNGEYM